jgi:hypothetical protein
MAVQLERFRLGDVYIDYPFENMMFHYVHETGRVFRKMHGDPEEDEVPLSFELFREAISAGTEIPAEVYVMGKPKE